MNKLIKLSKSSINDSEKKAVLKVLDKEYLGMGEEVKYFETQLEIYFEREVCCVVNGTAALQLAIQACDFKPDDEVIVSSLTYVSSFQAIKAAGAIPIACDIDLDTLCISIPDLERKINSKTKAIMPVHYSGGCGDLDKIYELANKYKLRIIEDAAHALNTKYKEKKIGSFGDIVCFSFDGIKNITSGEGGCVVTGDKNILKKIKDLRLLGVEKDTENRYSGKRTWEFDVKEQGWRYHMSNIMAAIGIEQLKKIDNFAEKRKKLSIKYDLLLRSTNLNIKLINHNYKDVTPHIYVVRILGLKNRRLLQEKLLDRNIQTGIHYQPNHLLSIFKGNQLSNFPNIEVVYPELLTLPLHTDLSESDIEYVVSQLNDILLNFKNLLF
jgi:dTDP-4-amino-4,6-dideoxygalactose transaminase